MRPQIKKTPPTSDRLPFGLCQCDVHANATKLQDGRRVWAGDDYAAGAGAGYAGRNGAGDDTRDAGESVHVVCSTEPLSFLLFSPRMMVICSDVWVVVRCGSGKSSTHHRVYTKAGPKVMRPQPNRMPPVRLETEMEMKLHARSVVGGANS